MTRSEKVWIWIAGIAVCVTVQVVLAKMGAPQQKWFFCATLGLC